MLLIRMDAAIGRESENYFAGGASTVKGGYTTVSSPSLIVYTLGNCPNCELLKDFLKSRAVPYDERDMSSVESLTDLRVNGVFAREAPVLQRDAVFLTSKQLFRGGAVVSEAVEGLIKGA